MVVEMVVDVARNTVPIEVYTMNARTQTQTTQPECALGVNWSSHKQYLVMYCVGTVLGRCHRCQGSELALEVFHVGIFQSMQLNNTLLL